MPRRRTVPLVTLAALAAFFLPGVPGHAGEEAQETSPHAFRISGRLDARTRTRDDERVVEWFLRVGAQEYRLAGQIAQSELRGARRKYVTVRGAGDAPHADRAEVVLAGALTLEVQKRAPLEGTVRLEIGPKRTKRYALETKDGLYAIARKDVRRFTPFVDLHVAATCWRVSDGSFHALEGVTKVERKLRPGERDPQDGAEALSASWRGVLTATKVPKGIPAAKLGDYKVHWTSTKDLERTEGRLMGSYDVVGVRVRKFDRKQRTARIELAYSFGQGSYAIMLEARFTSDWKVLHGDWKSGFLGSGTFRVDFAPPAKAP